MPMVTRRFFGFVAAVALALPSAATQAAQETSYPQRPVTLIVPYAAGGPTDAFARALAATWSAKLGQTILVENRTGAGTLVGTEFVAKAPPDGYTILLTTVAHAVNPSIHAKMPYKTVEDFAPVGMAAKAPLVIVVNKNFPPQNLTTFIDYIKTHPGKVTYGSAGVGSAPHLAAELLNYMTGAKTVHVPYRGSAPAMQDVIAGNVDFMIDSAPTGLAQVKAATVRLIATTMAQRLPQTPDTPAVDEVVPKYEAYTWNAVFAPVKTPGAIVAKLNATLRQALQETSLQNQAYAMGLVLETNPDPHALATFLNSELAKWSQVAKAAHMSAD